MVRTYSPVVQPYVDHLNTMLNATITDSRLSTLEGTTDSVMVVRFQEGRIFPLELGGGKWLHFRQRVQERGSTLHVMEARYIFSYAENVDDETQHIFRWEYDRIPREPHVPQAHLHVYATHPVIGNLARIHIPTRRLSVEQIIAHVILEYDVRPRTEAWRDILRLGHADFIDRTMETEREIRPFP